MATPDVIDFEALLVPISEKEPAGSELRGSKKKLNALFHDMRDARTAASDAERRTREWDQMSEEDQDREREEGRQRPDSPDWKAVIEKATKILTDSSKDLWVAAWLIEGLCRHHGFAGLRDGFKLVRQLSETFWDGINPPPDEDDGYATTVAQLTGLNGDDSEGTLIVAIKDIPITEGSNEGPFTSINYIDAGELDSKTDPQIRQQRIDAGAVTLDMFDKSVNETPDAFFENLMDDINGATEEFAAMSTVLDEKCGKDDDGYPLSPPTSNIKNALEECGDRVRSIARHVFDSGEPEPEEDDGGELATVENGDGTVATTQSKVQTRDDAFRALLQVADFFRRTEPHSPVSYALEQAVRWGRMSLPELMNELIGDDSARRDFFQRTGIGGEPDEE